MKRQLCCECGSQKEPRARVCQHLDGTIDYVCHACWKRLYLYYDVQIVNGQRVTVAFPFLPEEAVA